MDLKRFSVILLVFAGGLFLVSQMVTKKAPPAEDKGDDESAATQPAKKATPTTRPAVAATTQPGATTRPAIAASQPAPPKKKGPSWFDNSIKDDDKVRIRTAIKLGGLNPKDDYLLGLELTQERASIRRAQLARHYETVDDMRAAEETAPDDADAWGENPDGCYTVLGVLEYKTTKGKPRRELPLATRDLRVSMPGAGKIDYHDHWKLLGEEKKEDRHIVRFERTYYRAEGELADVPKADRPKFAVLRIVKSFEVRKLDYTVYVTFQMENLSDQDLEVTIDQAGPTGVRGIAKQDQRMGAYGCWDTEAGDPVVSLVPVKDMKGLEVKEGGSISAVEKIGGATHVLLHSSNHTKKPGLWVGHVNQYFGSMMYLIPSEGDKDTPAEANVDADHYLVPIEAPDTRTLRTGLRINDLPLAAGKTRAVNFELFIGPKKKAMFDTSDEPFFRERYVKLGYISTINLQGCFCQISWLTLGMMWLLQKLTFLTVGNYGIAIFLLVIIVRVLLHPLTKKGQVSMAKMQKLKPMMEKLKEKYADDKETLQKETMKLYREQGATPMLGCLPMLLQMPIWIALFTSLRASVELRHAAFLPVWITDLSAPDMLIPFGRSLPLIGSYFNLLPILVAISMYLQAKFNPSMSSGAATPEQQAQQKMMRWMMPAMMLVFFYQMPSGLNLYIMTSMFASAAEQALIRKHIQEKEALEAATVTTVTPPGKPPRGNRPKKPKGPMRFK